MMHASDIIWNVYADRIDFFTLDSPLATPRVYFGAGNFAAAVTDRPEVRQLMSFFTGDSYGRRWAAEGAGFLAPRREFDPGLYGQGDDGYANIMRALGAVVSDALTRDAWRFDASDLMPGPIGSFTDESEGAFYQAMLDLADGRVTAEEAAHRVEEAWRNLDLQGD